MTIQNIIKKIWKTEASDEMKNNLSWLLSNWDLFIELKQNHKKQGLMNECYKQFGLKFIGMYGLNKPEQALEMAKQKSYLI